MNNFGFPDKPWSRVSDYVVVVLGFALLIGLLVAAILEDRA